MIRHPRQQGFNLIELMISVTISLIVTAAAVALMVSIMQANGENIASTRLNQELRTVAEVMVRDLKRARYTDGTIFFVGEMNDEDVAPFDGVVQNCGDIDPATGTPYVEPCDWVPPAGTYLLYEDVTVTPASVANDGNAATTDGTCIRYGYEDINPADGSSPFQPFRSITLQPDADGIGAVWMAQAAADPGCDPADPPRLSSREVNITNLAFNYDVASDWLRVSVSGSLTNEPDIVRQFTTSLRFRSQAVPLAPGP